jgi:hypothetical protein
VQKLHPTIDSSDFCGNTRAKCPYRLETNHW